MSAHVHQLLQEYGLWLVCAAAALQALGVPVPGTTVLVAAAVYAATDHGLPIAGVIGAGALGATLGTCAGYGLGRWGGEPLLRRIGRWLRRSPDTVERLRTEFAVHGAAWLFVGRFITGVRNVSGLLAGASAMGFGRFLAVSAAAALAWSTVSALQYYYFGRALAGADTWVQVLLVAAGLVWMVFSLRLLRRRARRRLQRSPSGL